MKVVDTLSMSGGKINEDLISTGDNYAFVLDGATDLYDNIITKRSDALWYVKRISYYLNMNMEEEDLRTAIKKSIISIREEINSKNLKIDDKKLPSACIAAVKENKNNYEFFVLGDC